MDEATSRRISSARELLRALSDSFPQALEQKRLTAWATAAHSIVELLAAEDERPRGVHTPDGAQR